MNPVTISVKLSVGSSEYSNDSSIDTGLLADDSILRSVIEHISSDFEENLGRLLGIAGEKGGQGGEKG